MHQWIDDLDPWLAFDLTGDPGIPGGVGEVANPPGPAGHADVPRNVDVPEVTWYATVPAIGRGCASPMRTMPKSRIWSTGFDLLGEAAVDLAQQRPGSFRQRPPAGPESACTITDPAICPPLGTSA